MNKLGFIILIMGAFLFASCTKEHDNLQLNLNFEKDTVYFQFEYLNYAWGYQHYGLIIDQQGNIYDYNKPDNWNFPEDNQISLNDFKDNLTNAQVRLTQIPESELTQMVILAHAAKNGELTEVKYVMADAGEDTYSVYMATNGEQTLTKYLLQMRGDLYQKNTSAAADTITNWLIEFRNAEAVYGAEPFED